MPDPKEPMTIDQVMDAAWNQTMGEARDELPDEVQHLTDVGDNVEKAKSDIPVTPSPSPEDTGTPPVVAEPSGTPAVVEPGTPPAGPAEAPQHWSEADRSMFGTLTTEAKDFLLRRHREMEGDYTRKTQEHASAVKVGQAALSTMDPEIRRQLNAVNVSDDQFVQNLINYHKLSMTQPVEFVRQIVANLQLDPAKVFPPATEGGGAQPTPASDPVNARLAAIEGHLTREQNTRNQQVLAEAKTALEAFASEKGADGQPLRPHYEKVKSYMGRLMLADPDMDLANAYEVAVYRDPELRSTVPATNGVTVQGTVPVDMDKVRRGQEAAAAAKANRKGTGNGAAAPAGAPGKMTLQEAMNAAADEIGLK